MEFMHKQTNIFTSLSVTIIIENLKTIIGGVGHQREFQQLGWNIAQNQVNNAFFSLNIKLFDIFNLAAFSTCIPRSIGNYFFKFS